jgi:hypothetical protein
MLIFLYGILSTVAIVQFSNEKIQEKIGAYWMAEKFDEFLEEVEKDIRQEKLLQLWKKYGKQVTAGLVAIVILIAGYNLWSQYKHNKHLQMAEKLITAQELIAQGESAKAQTILTNLSQESTSTYQSLGLFQSAALLMQEGSTQKQREAIKIYDQLAGNKKIEPLWRDLAALLSIMVQIDLPDVKVDELLSQVEPLTSDQNPWRYFAKEMKGLLLYRKGDKAQSTEIFARLVQDSQTPQEISLRSRLMVQIASAGTSE